MNDAFHKPEIKSARPCVCHEHKTDCDCDVQQDWHVNHYTHFMFFGLLACTIGAVTTAGFTGNPYWLVPAGFFALLLFAA